MRDAIEAAQRQGPLKAIFGHADVVSPPAHLQIVTVICAHLVDFVCMSIFTITVTLCVQQCCTSTLTRAALGLLILGQQSAHTQVHLLLAYSMWLQNLYTVSLLQLAAQMNASSKHTPLH